MSAPVAPVSDHAVLQCLEGVAGLDVDAVRAWLGEKGTVAIEHGAGKVIASGLELRISTDGQCVATIVKIKQPKKCEPSWWLKEENERGQDLDPIDDGGHDEVVIVPYDGGNEYYHADVSLEMASRIIQAISKDHDVNLIAIERVDTDLVFETRDGIQYEAEVVEDCRIDWSGTHYGGKPTIAIMSPAMVEEMEHQMTVSDKIGSYIEMGYEWRPSPN